MTYDRGLKEISDQPGCYFHLHSSAQPAYYIFDKASPVFILIFILHIYGHFGDGEVRELES